ncbi:hypothetical protein ABID21_004964 [Pseudorhizobium tarimense]|uniref:Transposase n=1 Tax=Pseudorhizobium tarimense TaxID=1079109 RepID=A0ABV2HE54_9HYPH
MRNHLMISEPIKRKKRKLLPSYSRQPGLFMER